MKKLLTATALAGTLFLTACGDRVMVPPASKGMILGPNGYAGDIIPPSTFRLSWCLFTVCDKLVVIEAGDFAPLEQMEVLMPKDNLVLGVDVRFTLGLADNDAAILSVFDRVSPTQLGSGNYGVDLQTVYNIYGASVVRNVVRSVISKYTIAEVAANQAEVSEKLRQEISKALSKTPLEVKQFGLAGIDYPKAIREAMEATAQKKVDIEKAEASAQVSIREAQAKLEVKRAEREADLLEAKTIREADEILADGVTPELIRYRELQVLEKMADNKNAVFFPVDMIGSVGVHNRVFSTQSKE